MTRILVLIGTACGAAIIAGFLVLGAVVAPRLFSDQAAFVIADPEAGMLFSDILKAWMPLASGLLAIAAVCFLIAAAVGLMRGRRLWPATLVALIIMTGIAHGLLFFSLDRALDLRDQRFVIIEEDGRQRVDHQAPSDADTTIEDDFAALHQRSTQLVKIEIILLLLTLAAAPTAAGRAAPRSNGGDEG